MPSARRSFAPKPAHHARPLALLTSALATSLTCQIRFLVPHPIRSAPTGSGEHVARPTWPPPSPQWQHATPTVPPPSAQGAQGRLWERPAVGGGKTLVWGGSGSGPSGGRAPVRQQRLPREDTLLSVPRRSPRWSSLLSVPRREGARRPRQQPGPPSTCAAGCASCRGSDVSPPGSADPQPEAPCRWRAEARPRHVADR